MHRIPLMDAHGEPSVFQIERLTCRSNLGTLQFDFLAPGELIRVFSCIDFLKLALRWPLVLQPLS